MDSLLLLKDQSLIEMGLQQLSSKCLLLKLRLTNLPLLRLKLISLPLLRHLLLFIIRIDQWAEP